MLAIIACFMFLSMHYIDREPTSEDLSLNCSSRVNPQTGESYDLTMELVFSPAFTQIFQDQAVNFFLISVNVYDKMERPGPATGLFIMTDLNRANGSLQRFHTFSKQAALPSDQQYRLSVS